MSAIYFRAEVLPDILKVNISEEQLISFTLKRRIEITCNKYLRRDINYFSLYRICVH